MDCCYNIGKSLSVEAHSIKMALLTNFCKNQPFDKFVKDVVLKLAEESPYDKRLSKMNIHWRNVSISKLTFLIGKLKPYVLDM